MKIYKLSGSVSKKINQTLLKYMDYTIIQVTGGFTAKFVCFSDLEKKTVLKEGFIIQ
jgi:hypothetical protein